MRTIVLLTVLTPQPPNTDSYRVPALTSVVMSVAPVDFTEENL